MEKILNPGRKIRSAESEKNPDRVTGSIPYFLRFFFGHLSAVTLSDPGIFTSNFLNVKIFDLEELVHPKLEILCTTRNVIGKRIMYSRR